MRRLLLTLVLALLSVLPAGAQYFTDQAFGVNPFTPGTGGVPSPVFISYGQVRVCQGIDIGISGIPCPDLANISDINGNPLSVIGGNFGQLTTDVIGRYTFGCTAGSYWVQVAATSSNTPLRNFAMTCPVAASSSGIINTSFSGCNTYYGSPGIVVSGDCFVLDDGAGNMVMKSLSLSGAGAGVITVITGTIPAPSLAGQANYGVDLVSGQFKCVLFGGASCATGGGAGGAVLLIPAGAQTVVQPTSGGVTTALNVNNFNNIRYVQQYNWTLSPVSPASIAIGANVVNLTLCPPGIDVSNTSGIHYFVYVAGTGTPEAVPVTGGTCVPGAAGTIIFNAVGTHAAGYTISSASGGLQEASNDAGTPNAVVAIAPVGANANAINIQAPVYLHTNKVLYDLNGSLFTCNTRSRCLFVGDELGSYSDVTLDGARLRSGINIDGVHITNVSLTSNVLTVTTDANHNFSMTANAGLPDVVYAEFYTASNPQFAYHGYLTLASGSGTTYTTAFTHANVASVAAFGWTYLANTAIEDNAQHAYIRKPILASNGSNVFHTFITVDNDQKTDIDGLDTDGTGTRCTANTCTPIVLGRSDGVNASVITVRHANISLQCNGNGIMDFSGNMMTVEDSVVQGYAQFGIGYDGGLQGENLRGNYFEVGNCTNPYYTGSIQAAVGIMHQAQALSISGGNQAGTPAGIIPLLANTGATQRNYYIVDHSVANGYGPILLAGYALTNGSGNITVQWPQPTGFIPGTDTFDVLLGSGNFNAVQYVMPYVGSPNMLSLATGISGSCTKGMCSFTDTNGAGSAYSAVTAPSYSQGSWFWPASVFNGSRDDSNVGFDSTVNTDWAINGYQTVGQNTVTEFSTNCGAAVGNYSPALVSCLAASRSYGGYSSLVLSQTDNAGNSIGTGYKGRIDILSRPGGNLQNTPIDVITLFDSSPGKTSGTMSVRAPWDVNDGAFGYDGPNDNAAAHMGLYLRAPLQLSRYIGVLPNNANWTERLTSTLESYTVPVQVLPGSFASLPSCSGIEGARASVNDSTVTSVGVTIAGGGSNHVSAYCNGTNWVVDAGATFPYTARVSGSDFTTSSASLVNITGLQIPLLGSTAAVYHIVCDLYYSEATGSTAVQFGVQDVTTAPTSAIAGFTGSLANASYIQTPTITWSVTTAQNLNTITPAVITLLNGRLTATVEQPSGTQSNFNIMANIASGIVLTVKRGSSCVATIANN